MKHSIHGQHDEVLSWSDIVFNYTTIAATSIPTSIMAIRHSNTTDLTHRKPFIRRRSTDFMRGVSFHHDYIQPISPMRSESMDNVSPPRHLDYLPFNNPRPIGSPSYQRGPDSKLLALGDMSSSPFVPTILNQDAPSHFAFPKFQMYNGFLDPFDRLMHFLQIMTL